MNVFRDRLSQSVPKYPHLYDSSLRDNKDTQNRSSGENLTWQHECEHNDFDKQATAPAGNYTVAPG